MITFNSPVVVGRELEYLLEAASSRHLAGDGPFTKRSEGVLREILGSARVLLTTSCTHAIEMSALLLNVGPGDEVIVPSFTFVSTANAIAMRGARPVFADVRPDTLNLDERALEYLITPRTRAIVAVHYAGVGCDMDAILGVAAKAGIAVVEDNAHGLLGTYRGRPLGSLGTLATLSFHDTKNFTCGEGGALVVNDAALVERAEIIREKGTNRSRFFRGQVDKYTWVDLGSSYVPSELLAAFLLGQLEERESIQARRCRIFNRYMTELRDWAEACGVRLPHVPPECHAAYHLFYLRFPGLATRQRFIAEMKERGIHCVFHYLPLHLSEMGVRCGYTRGALPVTEQASDDLVRLPFYTTMTGDEQACVIDAIRAFRT
jgi:dTDP-4-amino-4,6-dideoxygalactose transaminase